MTIDANNILWLSENDIGLIKEDSYQGEGRAFIAKETYDEVTQALVKENKEITELAAKTRELNAKLGTQIRELQAALRAAAHYIKKSPCDPDITTEQLAAWQEYQKHSDLIESITPVKKEPQP